MPTTTDDLERITAALRAAVDRVAPGEAATIAFEPPRNRDFGDYATNVAFALAKAARRAPQALAGDLIDGMFAADASLRERVAAATPVAGFINLRMAASHWQSVVAQILREGAEYGRSAPSGHRISLEFGSANPTGPLVVVQGRALSVGATLANCMRFAGHDVTTEWITNDAGAQLDALGRSVYARYRQMTDPAFPFPEGGYPGSYTVPIASALRERDGARWETAPESEWLPAFSWFARERIVAEQRAVATRFGIAFDRWQSERELHDSGRVRAGIAALEERGLTYEREGATWMATTRFGDDKDRVLVRADGRPTYMAPDVAYHYEKLGRSDEVILILGPDHHGYIKRLETIAAAFGRPGAIEVVIAQLITLVRDGEIVSSSKRQGEILTLAEILDDVGVDAARFFFVMLSTDQPLTFDLTLATEASNENPVYYVQYGHARIASLQRRASPDVRARAERGEELERLVEPADISLARRLAEFPEVVRGVAAARAPHRLVRYARDVAAEFHQFYMAERVLDEAAPETSAARLAIAIAAKTVLASALRLLGVSAPERMERGEPPG